MNSVLSFEELFEIVLTVYLHGQNKKHFNLYKRVVIVVTMEIVAESVRVKSSL